MFCLVSSVSIVFGFNCLLMFGILVNLVLVVFGVFIVVVCRYSVGVLFLCMWLYLSECRCELSIICSGGIILVLVRCMVSIGLLVSMVLVLVRIVLV